MTTKEQVQEIESSIDVQMREMDLEENLLRRFKRTDIIMQLKLYREERNTLSESFNQNQYPDFYTVDSLVHFQIKLKKFHARIEKACIYCNLIENREKELYRFSFIEKQAFAYPTLCSMVEQMKLYIITDKYDLIDQADVAFQTLSKKLKALIDKPFEDYKSRYADISARIAEEASKEIQVAKNVSPDEQRPDSDSSVFKDLKDQTEEMHPEKIDQNNISIAVQKLELLWLKFLEVQSKQRNVSFKNRLQARVRAHLEAIEAIQKPA